ncbi:hypothetical protein EAG_16186 [Camponotus floridanus]|uniref:Uncharacterized protein n=1 Tax=Camponotus floridanus TaxID=104421 RepID=E2AGK5_CAMFO|nr:hypothetical protein EAG_16186 [Camponotus floridanus]
MERDEIEGLLWAAFQDSTHDRSAVAETERTDLSRFVMRSSREA